MIKSLRYDILKNIHLFVYNSTQAQLIENILTSVNFIERINYTEFEKTINENYKNLKIYLPSFTMDASFPEIKKELYTFFLWVNYSKNKQFPISIFKNIYKILFVFLSTPLLKYATESQKKNLFKLIKIFSFWTVTYPYFNKKDFSFYISLAERYFFPIIADDFYKVRVSLEKTNFNIIDAYFYLLNTYVFQFSIPENKLKILLILPSRLLKNIINYSNQVMALNDIIICKLYYLISISFYLLTLKNNLIPNLYKNTIDLFTTMMKNVYEWVEQIKNE